MTVCAAAAGGDQRQYKDILHKLNRAQLGAVSRVRVSFNR